MKKIVIITNIMSPYRVDLFNYISRNTNYDITIIYSAQNEDNRQWEIDQIRHKYVILKSRTIKIKTKLDWKYVHVPTDIISQLKFINPDVVIGSEYNPTVVISYFWSKKNKKKFISWSDGTLHSERNINYIQKKLRHLICKGADAFIASSTKTKETQEYYGANKKIFISYLTIDIKKYKIPRKNWGNKNIIYVGSLIERKGLDLLFKALAKVTNEYKLIIIGNGEEKQNLEILADNLGIREKINFEGFKQRKELLEFYGKSDIFILPTREDCFGLVINEAMCSGLPVISSKYADGAYDLIINDRGGYVIDPYNTEEFAGKIEYLLNNKDKVREMGSFNYEKIDGFSIENVCKAYIEAIDYVIC